MQKSYSGQHIYTFVIGKKSSAVFLSFVLLFGLFIILTGIFSKSPVFCSYIYNICSSHFSKSETEDNSKNILNILKPDIATVMQTATPVLYTPHHHATIISTASSDSHKENTPHSPERKLPEKNIKSENLSSTNETAYTIDLHRLSQTPTTYIASGSEPRVLILHTHACESYSDENGRGIGDAGTYRSVDNNKNMIRIGHKLTESLKKSGINAIHDTTLCDSPAYNNAYKNSLGVAMWYLDKYPSINFVFDIHRDAIADSSNNPVKLTCDINGIKTAQIMIVCGTDAMGLNHPDWTSNLTLASKIQSYLETNYPGIARPLNIRRERFNMHTTPGSLIFEIGTHANTIAEAERSIDILSEAIENVLLNKA